ncbi:MAG: hypothetical protein ACKOKB_07035, partial [Bacteroidota bacterium]
MPRGFNAAASLNLSPNARIAALVDPQPGHGIPVKFLIKQGVIDTPKAKLIKSQMKLMAKTAIENHLNCNL